MVETMGGFEHGGIGPGLGVDDIKEVAYVDEHSRFLVDDLICRFFRKLS